MSYHSHVPHENTDSTGSGTGAPFNAQLRDGRKVHVRPIRATDEDELVQAFERLNPEARYMRFMRVVKSPNLENLRKMLAQFPTNGEAIVAIAPATDGIDIVGAAFFVILDDHSTCEFAINVATEFGRTGLGRILMGSLIDAARRRGLEQMEGFVLSANQPMLGLARGLGFNVTSDPEDASVRICKLPLNAT